MKTVPKVSVLCLTYNHEKYIKKALDSFLAQKTNFNFEVIVHDDASTDRTVEIIRKYQKKYPEIIKPIFQTENQYSKKTWGMLNKFLFPKAKGKYIALCEGDDYWCDLNKLQIAVDTLDKNKDCIMFVHNTIIKKSDNNNELIVKTNPNYINNKFSLTNSIYTHLSARVFRKTDSLPPGDIFQYHYLLSKGLCYYYDKAMSVYRYNNKGIWSSMSIQQQNKDNIKSMYLLNKFLKWKYNNYYLSVVPQEIRYFQRKYLTNNTAWIIYLVSQKFTFNEVYNYKTKFIKSSISEKIFWKILETLEKYTNIFSGLIIKNHE